MCALLFFNDFCFNKEEEYIYAIGRTRHEWSNSSGRVRVHFGGFALQFAHAFSTGNVAISVFRVSSPGPGAVWVLGTTVPFTFTKFGIPAIDTDLKREKQGKKSETRNHFFPFHRWISRCSVENWRKYEHKEQFFANSSLPSITKRLT